MIATCPECGKRYRLADDAIPPAGRSVRCAACGHGWTVVPAAGDVADGHRPGDASPPDGSPAVRPAPPLVLEAIPPAAVGPPTVPAAIEAVAPPASEPGSPRRPRRIGWLAAVFALLAVAALAVIEFAPDNTFNPPRLGLPAAHLPMADLGSVRLPEIPTLPPLDLTRVPVIGDALDRLVHPPVSPLRVTVHGQRHRLATGGWLLTASGVVANPTAAPVPLSGIDAALLDPAGHVALRWRIAAPASMIGAHGSAAFETTAANFAADATILRLRPR